MEPIVVAIITGLSPSLGSYLSIPRAINNCLELKTLHEHDVPRRRVECRTLYSVIDGIVLRGLPSLQPSTQITVRTLWFANETGFVI